MIERFCPRCRTMIRSETGAHVCQRVARSDEDTQPIRVGELAGSRDPGFMSGPDTSEPDATLDPSEVQ